MSTLNAKRAKFESEVRGGKMVREMDREELWRSQDARDLEDAVELAKQGLLFMCLKEG